MLRSTDIQKQLEHGRILLRMTSCESFESILVLSLRDLRLNTVFKHLARCTNLQILFLSGNNIQALDIHKNMKKLKTVRKLDLSQNELTELPTDPGFFKQMAGLQFLALESNQFLTVDKISGLQGASNLRYLNLENNPIQAKLRTAYRYDVAKILPFLYVLDQNIVTYDERLNHLGNQSVRYCSMNTFTHVNPQATMSFVQDFPAAKHIKLLDEQIALMKSVNEKNDPVMVIQRSFRASAMRKVIMDVIKRLRNSVIKIQKHARGFLCRLKMQKQLISYFDSIGEIELTMSPEEVRRYRAIQSLKAGLPRMVYKWRVWKEFSRISTVVAKVYQSYKTRKYLAWALEKPLNLRENPSFTFLKEQKYLVKHILLRQTLFKQDDALKLISLVKDINEYKLMKHVDLDLYDMPDIPILQICMPPRLVSVARNKGVPNVIKERKSILEMCISQFGDKELQRRQLADLYKFKYFHRRMSTYEKHVASGKIIPERALAGINQVVSREQKATDSLLVSSRSSENQGSFRQSFKQERRQAEDAKDHKLFSKILRKEGNDFIRLNLAQSDDAEISTGTAALKLMRVFIRWNNDNPENCIHFYIGDLLDRQLAVSRIQKWFRQVIRIRKQRHALLQAMESQKNQKITILLQPNQLTFLRCLQHRRAVICIQQYWKMYRLKKRIQMLVSLKEYLSHVTQETLCIEQHLYENLTNIQFSCLYNNTIPETHCFAFDFVESKEQEDEEVESSWDLVYTADQKTFNSRTNQTTHNYIRMRFLDHCVPNWVVNDNLEISKRSNFQGSHDKNNTQQIFHKTQKVKPTEVLDYNQIVEPENRTFVMNNGLRFVVIHCASVIDAQRRALALAMITLDRKKGDFLKIFCPNQLFSGTFLPNIQGWWNLKEIKDQVPENYLRDLVQPGRAELEQMPLDTALSHNGFILSAKDYMISEVEQNMHSVLIKRQRNNDELQMKLVLPKNVTDPESFDQGDPYAFGLQRTLNVDLAGQAMAIRLQSASTQMSQEVRSQDPSQQQNYSTSNIAPQTLTDYPLHVQNHLPASNDQNSIQVMQQYGQQDTQMHLIDEMRQSSRRATESIESEEKQVLPQQIRQIQIKNNSSIEIDIQDNADKNMEINKERESMVSSLQSAPSTNEFQRISKLGMFRLSSQQKMGAEDDQSSSMQQKQQTVRQSLEYSQPSSYDQMHQITTAINVDEYNFKGSEAGKQGFAIKGNTTAKTTKEVKDSKGDKQQMAKRKTRPVSNNTVAGKKAQNVVSGATNQTLADKSRKSLVASSYGIKRPPKKPTPRQQQVNQAMKVGSSSIESGRIGQQQSQTTKEDSMGTHVIDYSLENIHSLGQFTSQQKNEGQSRVQSGLGLRVKNSLNAHQSKVELPDSGNPLFTQANAYDSKAIKSSQQLRRPMTSIQTSQVQQQNNITEMSTLRDRPSEEHRGQGIQTNQSLLGDQEYGLKPGGPQSMSQKHDLQGSANILYAESGDASKQDQQRLSDHASKPHSYRIKSAIYHRKSNRSFKAFESERQRALEVASFNQQRMSHLQLKEVQSRKELETKSLNVQKQRTVQHLLQNAIKDEKTSKLQLIQKLGRLHKEQNILQIRMKESQDVTLKSIQQRQRAQSSYNVRSRQMEHKAQAQKITGAVNMLNKINVERLRQEQRMQALKSAKSKMNQQHHIPPGSITSASQSYYQIHQNSSYENVTTMSMHNQPNNKYNPLASSTESLPQTNIATQRINQAISRQNSAQVMVDHLPLYHQAYIGPLENQSVRNIIVSKQIVPGDRGEHENTNLVSNETLLNESNQHIAQSYMMLPHSSNNGNLYYEQQQQHKNHRGPHPPALNQYYQQYSDYAAAQHQVYNQPQSRQNYLLNESQMSNQLSNGPFNQTSGIELISNLGTPLYARFDHNNTSSELMQPPSQAQTQTGIQLGYGANLMATGMATSGEQTTSFVAGATNDAKNLATTLKQQTPKEINNTGGAAQQQVLQHMPQQQQTSATNLLGNADNNTMVVDPYTQAINRDIESDMVKSHDNMFTAFALPNHLMQRQSEQASVAALISNSSNHRHHNTQSGINLRPKQMAAAPSQAIVKQQQASKRQTINLAPVVMKEYQLQTSGSNTMQQSQRPKSNRAIGHGHGGTSTVSSQIVTGRLRIGQQRSAPKYHH